MYVEQKKIHKLALKNIIVLFCRLIMPKTNLVQKSGFKFNITEPFVDIRYTASASVINCISLINITIFIVIINSINLI